MLLPCVAPLVRAIAKQSGSSGRLPAARRGPSRRAASLRLVRCALLFTAISLACSEAPSPKSPAAAPPPAVSHASGRNKSTGRAAMTSRVAGYSFGMTEHQAKRECELAGGQALSMAKPRQALLCTAPRVTLDFPVEAVAFSYCAERVCEIKLMVDMVRAPQPAEGEARTKSLQDRHAAVTQTWAALVGKYRAPDTSEGIEPDDLVTTCARSGAAERRATWWFNDADGESTEGRLLLAYRCQSSAKIFSSTLILFYDDKEGARMRLDEREQRQSNF